MHTLSYSGDADKREEAAVYNFTLGPANVDVRGDHAHGIREAGAEGIVLVKNTNNALPLASPKNIGVFGNDAADLTDGLYFLALGFDPYEIGVLPAGGGSGTGRFSYVVPPLDAIKTRAAEQGNGALVQYVTNNSRILDGTALYVENPAADWKITCMLTGSLAAAD